MVLRLHDKFDVQARSRGLKTYGLRNTGRATSASFARGRGNSAVEIMTKVFEEGHHTEGLQKVEKATLRLFKDGGMRDYIDLSLTEVEQYVQCDKNGQVSGFMWRAQGNGGDIPALRRSKGENGVHPEVIEALISAKIRIEKCNDALAHLSSGDRTQELFKTAVDHDKALRRLKPEEPRFSQV